MFWSSRTANKRRKPVHKRALDRAKSLREWHRKRKQRYIETGHSAWMYWVAAVVLSIPFWIIASFTGDQAWIGTSSVAWFAVGLWAMGTRKWNGVSYTFLIIGLALIALFIHK